MLDVPRDLIWFVSGLLAARRRSIGTRKKTRKLGCYRQAVFGLAWFRDKGSIPRLGAGSGLSQATAYRYLDEVIDVLAEQAPGLREAPERALAEGTPNVILDGKVVHADRCREKTVSRKGKEIDLWYSGKRKDSGGNIQAVFYPDGRPMRVSDVLPGNVNDPAGTGKRPGDAAALRAEDARPGRWRVRRRRSRRPHPGEEARGNEGTGHQRPHAQRADPLGEVPGRTRLRPADPAMANPSARHHEPRENRPDRTRRPRPDAIRAQNARLKSLRKLQWMSTFCR